MSNPLVAEFEYYLANQGTFVEKYIGKYIVIQNRQVIGVYDDEITAINETRKTHELGKFLVQKVERGNGAYTQTFHSRVVFA